MGLTHLNDDGRARMVNVTDKKDTVRTAVAKGTIRMLPKTLQAITDGKMKKGDVLSVAQIAGIIGVKKTSDLIPMCHNIFITGSDMNFEIDDLNNCIHVESIVTTTGKTGVEMEALTAVTTALLTVYDMCKAIDKEMTIENVRLIKKTGGKSGDFYRKEDI